MVSRDLTVGFLPRILTFLPALKRGEDWWSHIKSADRDKSFPAHAQTCRQPRKYLALKQVLSWAISLSIGAADSQNQSPYEAKQD
jgi:hypothetical protein